MITEKISCMVLNDFVHAVLQGCKMMQHWAIQHYFIVTVFTCFFPLYVCFTESKHHLNHAIKSFAQWQLNVMDMSDSVPAKVHWEVVLVLVGDVIGMIRCGPCFLMSKIGSCNFIISLQKLVGILTNIATSLHVKSHVQGILTRGKSE